MSLASFTPATADIMHKDQVAFTVRGLSLSDLSHLMRTSLPDIQVMVGMWNDYQAQGAAGDIWPFLTVLATEAPILVSHLIACGAGEPEMHTSAKNLPVPLQIEALSHLFRLTFEEYGGLEKMLAALATMARGFGVTLPQTPPSNPGLSPAQAKGKPRK